MSNGDSEATEEKVKRFKDRQGMVYQIQRMLGTAKCYGISCKRMASFEIVKGIGYPKRRQLLCPGCLDRLAKAVILSPIAQRTES